MVQLFFLMLTLTQIHQSRLFLILFNCSSIVLNLYNYEQHLEICCLDFIINFTLLFSPVVSFYSQ